MADIAKHRIFVDAAGNPVDENDPKATSLAVPKGNPIPADIAAKLAKPSAKRQAKSAD